MKTRLLVFCVAVFLAALTASVSADTSADKPLTWQRDYFPEFRIEIAEDNLHKLLHNPSTKDNPDLTKYPITLHYQNVAIKGTIRLRGGNASRCGDKRQFRLDFEKKTTLPDGYRTDRFETDHGICNTLNEWAAWQLLDEAAARHPEINVLRKHSNVVAIYFNDRLYHVQSLLEDVSKDVLERHLGTRNVIQFKHGCYGLPKGEQAEITDLCRTSDPAAIASLMDAESFVYVNALAQVMGSADMFPAYPWNWYLIYNQDTGRTHFLAHDFDMAIDYVSGAQHDPYAVVLNENFAQWQLEGLLADAAWQTKYRQYVSELTMLIDPQFYVPLLLARYEQIRDTLLASPDLPFGAWYYDAQYRQHLPQWSADRFAYLQSLSGNAPRPTLSWFGTTLWSDGEPYASSAADFNRDSHPDLAIANADHGSVTIITGLKDGRHWWGSSVQTFQTGGNPVAIHTFDADRDGWPDIALADYSGNAVTIWRNGGNGGFEHLASMPVAQPLSVSAFAQDGSLWSLVVVADGADGNSNLHRARLRGNSIELLPTIGAGSFAQSPAFGDFNGDGNVDAAIARYSTAQLTIVFSVTTENPVVQSIEMPFPLAVSTVADFDRDGLLDIAALTSDSHRLIRIRHQGDGSFVVDNMVELPTGYWAGYWASMATGDFDGDAFTDVAITDYTEGIIRVFRGSPSGFSNSRSSWVGTGNKGYGTLATDLNEDGKADIVALAGRQSWVSIFINHGGLVAAAFPVSESNKPTLTASRGEVVRAASPGTGERNVQSSNRQVVRQSAP
jgi:hypothetical protein